MNLHFYAVAHLRRITLRRLSYFPAHERLYVYMRGDVRRASNYYKQFDAQESGIIYLLTEINTLGGVWRSTTNCGNVSVGR